jgi:hypothetical protein
VARTNRVKELRPLVPQLLDALGIVKAGEVITVGDERRSSQHLKET